MKACVNYLVILTIINIAMQIISRFTKLLIAKLFA